MNRQEDEPEVDPWHEHGVIPHSTYEDAVKFRSFIQRTIHLDTDVDTDSASTLVLELAALSVTPEPIKLRISSNGGNVVSELAVIDAIRAAQHAGCELIGEVYGHGMSAAFMILQACDVRRMGANSVLMVHGITSWAMGDLKDIKAEQKMLTHLQIAGARLIAHRNTAPEGDEHTTEEFWIHILQDNVPVYLFPDEALEWGVVDEVL